ncbi:SEL1-like repeat protein, partial (plasmid) [Enterobacter hormaechei]
MRMIFRSQLRDDLMPSLSVERWLALATAGDSQARFHLGKIFSCGLGVHQDYKQAIYWFQLAAE